MNSVANDTILVVCDDEEYSHNLTSKLFDSGINVVGPVPRANLALLLAAQTSPTLAIVATPPTGRRDAAQLARALMDTWAVRTLILDTACPEGIEPGEQPWDPHPSQLAGLREALERMHQPAPPA